MQVVREKAFICVGRAVFFAALAIMVTMLGLAYDPAAALKAGAILAFVVVAVLIWFAQTALQRLPPKTETWLLLKPDERPTGVHADRIFSQVLEETYLYFAGRAFAVAVSLLVSAIAVEILLPSGI